MLDQQHGTDFHMTFVHQPLSINVFKRKLNTKLAASRPHGISAHACQSARNNWPADLWPRPHQTVYTTTNLLLTYTDRIRNVAIWCTYLWYTGLLRSFIVVSQCWLSK